MRSLGVAAKHQKPGLHPAIDAADFLHRRIALIQIIAHFLNESACFFEDRFERGGLSSRDLNGVHVVILTPG